MWLSATNAGIARTGVAAGTRPALVSIQAPSRASLCLAGHDCAWAATGFDNSAWDVRAGDAVDRLLPRPHRSRYQSRHILRKTELV